MPELTIYTATCDLCKEKLAHTDKDQLSRTVSDHLEHKCPVAENLRELSKMNEEDRTILIKVMEESEQIDALKKFLKRHKLAIETARGYLDDIEAEQETKL